MTTGSFSFAEFDLDVAERRLQREGTAIELNGRYLDALILLVSAAGRLVTKDRFMDEVWCGVPVTDEALTQCIKTLRRQLGDDAARPRFIETVPKHGYRFIAAVRPGQGHGIEAVRATAGAGKVSGRVVLGVAGTLGGGLAGLLGGLFYGFAAAAQPSGPEVGAASTVVVVALVCLLVALLGGAGVSTGIAALATKDGQPTAASIAGGALGGLLIGAVVRLIGLDAFNLLLGRAPNGIAGPFEGVALGAAVGVTVWLAGREERAALRRAVSMAVALGGAAGLLTTAAGGRLMAGSLDLLARAYPGSRLQLDFLANSLGEDEFGRVSSLATGTIEAGLFSGCIVAAMVLGSRSLPGVSGRLVAEA